MGHLLEWYSKYNSLIIQSLSVVIGGLLVFFIFRLFFIKENNQDVHGSDRSNGNSNLGGIHPDQFESKIQQILTEEKLKKGRSDFSSGQNSADSSEIIDQLQAEIFNLKQTIKEAGSRSQAANLVTEATLSPAKASVDAVDVAGYQKEIEELKNRLSDYEVIAEDISDLHKLREENKNLLAQIGVQGSSPQPTNQMAAEDVQNLIQDLTDDLVVTDRADVTADEKDLIQQFEKLKG